MFQSLLTNIFKNKNYIKKMQMLKFSTFNKLNIERLKFRTLVRVSGTEVTDFLQGLITNDIKHLENNNSMYAMFLNTKGRVLYDTIIYKTEEKSYCIECDTNVVNEFQRHLKMYRVRRKIDIVDISNEYHIWVVFNPNIINISTQDNTKNIQSEENIALNSSLSEIVKNKYNELMIYKDPRMLSLGIRILTPSNLTLNDIQNHLNIQGDLQNDISYKLIRYKLGVGEGVYELPPGNCFPLEANCDYLHGVSFHKGCYIGQELTARTHHTGVIRKRLMPIFFQSDLLSVPDLDTTIITADDKKINVGKFKGAEKNVGLGLLRIEQALKSEAIEIASVTGITMKPHWWPIEAPKEITTLGKN